MAISPRVKVQKFLSDLSKVYHDEIPLKEISECIKENGGLMVQEDESEWAGFLCGTNDSTTIKVNGIKTTGLRLSWYKMQSGRYEITAYLM
jgi:hypothetical protein